MLETQKQTCPKCNNENVVKNGKAGKYQNYLCRNCKHQFAPDKPMKKYSKDNESNLSFAKRTYATHLIKLRKDTYPDLIAAMGEYAKNNPQKGALSKKIIEILSEHFPDEGNKKE